MTRVSTQIRCLLVVLAVSVFATATRGDVIPYSGAEVARNIAVFRIEDEGVRLELEIYPEDLAEFERAFQSRLASASLTTPAKFHQSSGEGLDSFRIVRADGKPLPFDLLTVERRQRIDRASPFAGMTDPLTGRPIPGPPENPDVVYLEVFYSFEGARPETLILSPPYAEDGAPAASIGFMVFDRSVPVSRFSFLKTDMQLTIDWTDPWFSAFTNPNLNRSAQDGTSSFLYVAPRELRHEILIRVRDLAPWIDQELTTGTKLDPAHQSQILAAALDELKDRNPMSISGEAIVPAAARGTFLTLGERGFQVVEGAPTLVTDTTFVGVILTYPISELPATASINWDMFDNAIQTVPVTLTDIAGPFFAWASPDEPVVTWTNHLKRYDDPKVAPVQAAGIFVMPVWAVLVVVLSAAAGVIALLSSRKLAIGIAALSMMSLFAGIAFSGKHTTPVLIPISGQSDTQIATGALSRLLTNTYVAALEVFPEERKKALEPIVFDASLTDVAAELETSLTIRVPGGGRAQITDVSDVVIVQGEMTGKGRFEGVVQWRVDARAGHWGHDHRRRVDYRARVEFRPDRGNWLLSAITVLEARSPDV
ncbi:hypothetical protein [Ruegeria arenilitoris]|uniref:hypothetical protein n=1 Tax=Ruegeria arenilitoris TaxID=1173585 RepID=UPI00147AFD91|nr:hypothetical protein [Ruegeria arenilitoris]